MVFMANDHKTPPYPAFRRPDSSTGHLKPKPSPQTQHAPFACSHGFVHPKTNHPTAACLSLPNRPPEAPICTSQLAAQSQSFQKIRQNDRDGHSNWLGLFTVKTILRCPCPDAHRSYGRLGCIHLKRPYTPKNKQACMFLILKIKTPLP